MTGAPSGTVTFLFTDVEGSTQRWERDAEAMSAALQLHDDLLRQTIEVYGGVVFKTVGDAFCATFHRAGEALGAALGCQRRLCEIEWGDAPLRVRMALHTGSAEERGGDYFGPPVNRVARLLASGHGGQILMSLATYELVRDEPPEGVRIDDLGVHRLRDLTRPEHIYQVVAVGQRSAFPPLKTLDAFAHNLPVQSTRFIGREGAVQQVRALIEGERLVTLTGPGGTGKTRLALQVAGEMLEVFPDGVWLVELAALDDPGLVAAATAAVLGVQEQPGQSLLTGLTTSVVGRRLLLVLDNCEHLLLGAATVAEALLQAGPHVRILATSREPLGIGGERRWPVPPLRHPEPGSTLTGEALSQYEAVQLFIDRGIAVRPGFAVTNQTAPAVAQLCYQLDGIPLAIELAAVERSLPTANSRCCCARSTRRTSSSPSRQPTRRGWRRCCSATPRGGLRRGGVAGGAGQPVHGARVPDAGGGRGGRRPYRRDAGGGGRAGVGRARGPVTGGELPPAAWLTAWWSRAIGGRHGGRVLTRPLGPRSGV